MCPEMTSVRFTKSSAFEDEADLQLASLDYPEGKKEKEMRKRRRRRKGKQGGKVAPRDPTYTPVHVQVLKRFLERFQQYRIYK